MWSLAAQVMFILLKIRVLYCKSYGRGLWVFMQDGAPVDPEEEESLIAGALNLDAEDDEEDAQAMMEEELRAELTTILEPDPHKYILIKGDEQARYADVRVVMEICEELGAKSVGLQTEDKPKPVAKES